MNSRWFEQGERNGRKRLAPAPYQFNGMGQRVRKLTSEEAKEYAAGYAIGRHTVTAASREWERYDD